jgi:hypothetical protein
MFTIIGADQKEYGPVSADDIRQWIKDGRADGRTLGKLEGSSEWKPLAMFAEFAGLAPLGAKPPPLPPAYSNDPRTPLLAPELNFNIVECLGRGRALLLNNFGVLMGGTFLVWLIDLARYIPFVSFLDVFIEGVLYGGLFLLFLKKIRGQAAGVGEIFSGFGVPFIQLLLVGFVMSLLTELASLLCFFPGVYLKIAWIFALPLVIDKRLEFWTALELSRKVVTRVWFKLFVLAIAVFAPVIIFDAFIHFQLSAVIYPKYSAFLAHGIPDLASAMSFLTDLSKLTEETLRSRRFVELQMTREIILLINLPLAMAALMYAYEALFGPRPAPAA